MEHVSGLTPPQFALVVFSVLVAIRVIDYIVQIITASLVDAPVALIAVFIFAPCLYIGPTIIGFSFIFPETLGWVREMAIGWIS